MFLNPISDLDEMNEKLIAKAKPKSDRTKFSRVDVSSKRNLILCRIYSLILTQNFWAKLKNFLDPIILKLFLKF